MSKHQYTCPDVIYLRNRNRKINLATLGGTAALAVFAYAAGWYYERKEAKSLANFDGETVTD